MASNGQAADNGQHNKAQNIVDNRCAQNDASLGSCVAAKIAQHARGDANARGRQDAADK